MLVLRSFDSAYAAVAEVNSDGDPERGWFVGAIVLAAPLFVIALAINPDIAALGKYQAIAMLGPLPLGVAMLYGRLRLGEISKIRSSLPKPVPRRSRLVFAAWLIVSTASTAMASKISPLAGACVVILIACLPWSSWAGVPGAP